MTSNSDGSPGSVSSTWYDILHSLHILPISIDKPVTRLADVKISVVST